MTYSVGDSIEFELAPDGYCSRWTFNGFKDRGATNKWLQGKVAYVTPTSYGKYEMIVIADNGDRYRFEINGRTGYPSQGLRLLHSVRGPRTRLVERTDPVSKSRYWATEER